MSSQFVGLLQRLVAAEEDHIETALLQRLHQLDEERKQQGRPELDAGEAASLDDAARARLLDQVFLPWLPFQNVRFGGGGETTSLALGRLFGWLFLDPREISTDGGLGFLGTEGAVSAAVAQRQAKKEVLFVALAPVALDRFIEACQAEPQPGLYFFRAKSLWLNLAQAVERQRSPQRQVIVVALLRLITTLCEWHDSLSLSDSKVELEVLAGLVLQPMDDVPVALLALRLIRVIYQRVNPSDLQAAESSSKWGQLGARLLELIDHEAIEIRECAISCIHPGPIEDPKAERFNRLWDVCTNGEDGVERKCALKQLASFYRSGSARWTAERLESVLPCLQSNDFETRSNASHLLATYLLKQASKPHKRTIDADLSPQLLTRIVEILRRNTLWQDTSVVPSLTDLSQERLAADLEKVEANLARLPAELREGLSPSAQQAPATTSSERNNVRQTSAGCMEQLILALPERALTEIWSQVVPLLRQDVAWPLRESALLVFDVMSYAAQEQANELVGPHVPFIVASLGDPVEEVQAIAARALLQYLPLLARDPEQLSIAIGSLAALAKKGPTKASEAALFGLLDLLPLLAQATRCTRIVEECLAIWDDLPREVIPIAVELLTTYKAIAEQEKSESGAGEDEGDELLRRVIARLPSPLVPCQQ